MQKRVLSHPTVAVITFTLFLALFSAAKDDPHFRSAQWPIAGQDLSNSWNQPAEHLINPANVHTLAPKWVFTTVYVPRSSPKRGPLLGTHYRRSYVAFGMAKKSTPTRKEK